VSALTIARFTVQEAVRRRLILAGLLLSLLFLVLFGLGFSLLFEREAARPAAQTRGQLLAVFGSLMTLMGLYAVHFLSSFLALFLSVGAISAEIDSGALHAILARPIRRAEFVLGRWLAYAGLVGLYVGLMAGLVLLLAYLIAGYQVPDPTRAVALMVLGAVLLLTVSLLGSTLLSTLANGVVVFTLFGLAWLAGIMELIGSLMDNESLVTVGIAVSLLVPSDALWRAASFYLQSPLAIQGTGGVGLTPFSSPAPPTLPFVLWSLCYPIALLFTAILAFSRRDL
jgi:Cu-processing system permease protein